MAKGQAKGSQFERTIAKRLSLWWTNHRAGDVFWRTPQSGGRATIRSKKNRGSSGHYGDIQATDHRGRPLVKIVTIELKTGYPGVGMEDLLDHLPGHTPMYEKFVIQAIEESQSAKTPYWLLITRRFCKTIMIYMPWDLYLVLKEHGACIYCQPRLRLTSEIAGHGNVTMFGTTLHEFMKADGVIEAFHRLAVIG